MKLRENKIYVIGHKNPDTDAICSAISYAYLKNKIEEKKHGSRQFEPRRAGQLNPETSFVLETFHTEVPAYLNDVRTKVKDADLKKSYPVPSSFSLKNAWGILNERNLATLPVVDDENHLIGLITLGDIARSFMGEYGSTILAEAKTPYKNILETLDGKLLTGDENKIVTKGKVLVAAANPDLMENYIEEGDIVILGDRYESQLCAIEMNASCLIVCMGVDVSPSILASAKKKNCAIITTEHDTFITSRLVNQSIPISHFMVSENLITFQMDQYIEDIKNIVSSNRHRDFPVVDAEGHYIAMFGRGSLIEMDKKKMILVDHNERSQAIDGIADAEILEIIDHHKLGHVETLSPVTFRDQPVGCTSTIIYTLFLENRVEIPADIAGLMCSAIISDTLLFRSPTCTVLDRQAATKLAEIAHINLEEYANQMFEAGSNLKGKSAKDIFYQDFKKFTAGKTTFGVGQISAMNQTSLNEVKDRLFTYFPEVLEGREVDMIFFMLTNILTETTELLCYDQDAIDVAADAFGQKPNGSIVLLPGVVSRKKQLIPKLMVELQKPR